MALLGSDGIIVADATGGTPPVAQPEVTLQVHDRNGVVATEVGTRARDVDLGVVIGPRWISFEGDRRLDPVPAEGSAPQGR